MNVKKEYFTIEDIKNNKNLILNLRNDNVFKNVFLNELCKPYLCLLLSKIYNLNYDNLLNNLSIRNNELPSNEVKGKSCFTDLICHYKNIDFIIEMNGFKLEHTIHKNYRYVFKQYIKGLCKKNKYGLNKYTYLISIDNYDQIGKDKLIYENYFNIAKHNICIYKNIKATHINLAYLKNKYYNKDELNELEKILLIFVEQNVLKLKKNIKYNEIEGVIKVMKELDYEDNYIATYDREEYERLIKEEWEEKQIMLERKINKFENRVSNFENKVSNFKNKVNNFEKEKNIFESEKNMFESEKNMFESEKNSIVKELKLLGVSLKKISKITKIPIEKLKLLN